MTQNEKVLAYIQKHGSITPREAFAEFDIMRLASRISDLKKLGIGAFLEASIAAKSSGTGIRMATSQTVNSAVVFSAMI